ncbi:mismatched base pair and cruciform DNA recognition protein [Sporothrix brasiliensis 5110]|uniref:Mismatched base pair and cruciform DNA recognition protein n=1 Tax=Sporothrix brasiliensis 5110 TaxID=1398154 RepID=A0A0C2FBW4_9PEZI|nr:mismatched base pair and cruciform DNA recognition protein [Sporothrix brasiliensis 5110]KIH88568.1 mismatched base pair and cruciform DNA recognition protein [Sporothrix brasiliensis 5110]
MSSSNTNNNGPSTVQSYIDSAVGTVQSAIGNLTGSAGQENAGDAKKEGAKAEYDASHATVKGPGFTASSAGAVTRDDPDRATGSWNQTIGSAKEAIGGLVGSESLKSAGREQNRSGQEQEARGQVNDFVSGAADRVKGTIGGGVANLTGNTGAEAEYQRQHDVGKTQQRGAEVDIQKQSEAERARRE